MYIQYYHPIHCRSLCTYSTTILYTLLHSTNTTYSSDPDQNTVMDALKDNPNRKAFSEKLMLLINREEDPVCLKEPLVPDSMTKFCLDLFSSEITAGMLYTSDLKVLIDIITRQLSDRAPGDQVPCVCVCVCLQTLSSLISAPFFYGCTASPSPPVATHSLPLPLLL